MAEQEIGSLVGFPANSVVEGLAHLANEQNDRSVVAERMAQRLHEATVVLQDSIEINVGKRGGVPVLRGTRVPIAQILAELANNFSLAEIADDLDLSEDLIRGFLQGMALHFDRPFFK